MVALILAALLHGVIRNSRQQTDLLAGPLSAHRALLLLARETACAFAPPDSQITPFSLTPSSDPADPEIRIEFYLPVPSLQPDFPGFYGLERITYESVLRPGHSGERELRRISVPCAGARTNLIRTNILFRGSFHFSACIPDSDSPSAPASIRWPLPDADSPPTLPPSVQYTLHETGHAPLQTETFIQTAHPLPSPKDIPPASSAE